MREIATGFIMGGGRDIDCGVAGVTIKAGSDAYLVEVVRGRPEVARFITTTAIDTSVPTEALLAIVADRLGNTYGAYQAREIAAWLADRAKTKEVRAANVRDAARSNPKQEEG